MHELIELHRNEQFAQINEQLAVLLGHGVTQIRKSTTKGSLS